MLKIESINDTLNLPPNSPSSVEVIGSFVVITFRYDTHTSRYIYNDQGREVFIVTETTPEPEPDPVPTPSFLHRAWKWLTTVEEPTYTA